MVNLFDGRAAAATDLFAANPVLTVIAAGEIGFWVLLALALAVRYLLRLRTLSTVLLWGLPVVDLIVLVAAVIDLRAGGEARLSHGLAATYVGVTVVFGHRMVRWADQRIAHRFAGGPEPHRPPTSGWARVRYEWQEWGRFALAWVLSCAIMLGLVAMVGDDSRVDALFGSMRHLTVVLVVWLIGWPVWVSVREVLRPGAHDG
ncbi:hypothetical protein [Pseudonocardia spinosispora]|uniref:hypothetical protein n=1 Tax=Pseudonocardia spinosispora TaxID=103441 RepID=UPI00068780BD|nr:hypothetical protein [Pseudonocardia spinosispora]